jgi:hypothetical protein
MILRHARSVKPRLSLDEKDGPGPEAVELSGVREASMSSAFRGPVIVLLAVFAFANCGGAGTTPPQGAMSQSRAHEASGKSWMLPEARHEDLLYVNDGSDTVRVVSFPDGKPVGMLNDIVVYPSASCSGADGNVFIVSGGDILEFAHGEKKRINTFSLGTNEGLPISCSVNPGTGDLAATVLLQHHNYVAIFPKDSDNPEKFTSQLSTIGDCVYDSAGNLYVDGESGSANFQLTELPEGSSSFANLTLNERVTGNYLQWDGQYLVLDSFLFHPGKRNTLYQIRVAGSTATVVAAIQLKGSVLRGAQPWLAGNRFAVSNNRQQRTVGIWPYPAGGGVTKRIPSSDFLRRATIRAVTVSVAPPATRIRR